MTGDQARQTRNEGLDLGEERIPVEPSAACSNTIYVRALDEALSDLEARVAKRLKPWRYQYQPLLLEAG